jgi:acetyltransferase-like isoleucine patch superfamily enzyme
MFTFPYQVTVALHRLRGVKIGKKSHVARGVVLDDRNPDLIEIGKGVAITSGVMILCHQRDLTNYRPGMYAMQCPFKEGKVVIKDGAHIGIGAIVMPGVTIGEGAIIGAGSVVQLFPVITLNAQNVVRLKQTISHRDDNHNMGG